MPSFSWSAFAHRAVESLRPSSRVAEPLFRLHTQIRDYCMKTTPRRRLSRAMGIGLFGCFTVAAMGNNGCGGCPSLAPPGQANIVYSVLNGAIVGYGGGGGVYHVTSPPGLHANFTGTDGSTTGAASFLGNFTAITQDLGNYFVMVREKDCSLSLVTGSSTLNGSSTLTNAKTHYEQTLHQLGSLKTTPNAFPKGCDVPPTGISTRAAVYAGVTTQGSIVFATAQGNGSNNAVFVLTTTATLTPISFSPIASLTAATAVATADLNNDGSGDLVVVNSYNATSSYVSVVLGNGDGTFKTPVNYPIAGNMSVAAVIDDVNNDGKLDIVAVSDTQQISVLLGNGDGTFQSAQSFAAPTLPGYTANTFTPVLGLITADVNGDGKKDLILSNGAVLLGNGNGTFSTTPTIAFPYTSSSPGGFGPGLAAGDINNDGKLDLAVNTGSSVTTYLGKGDGTFTAGASYASINNSGYITLVDLDGDGNLDLYSGLADGIFYSGDDTNNAAAYVLMGNGDGTFVGASQAAGAYNGTNLGDVNGDGVPDLIVNNASGSFTVQLGNGHGLFTTASTITAPSSFVLSGYTFSNAATTAASTYAVGDVNGDGKADLVFIDNGLTAKSVGFPITYAYPVLFVALSNGDGTFQTPVPYALPQIAPSSGYDNTLSVSGLQIADINHDGKNDLIFTYNELAGGPGTIPYNQGFAVLTGVGNGTFSATPILTSTYSSNTAPTIAVLPTILTTTDLNADSKPDLIVNMPSTTIIFFQLQTTLQTYIGNGDGTFKAPTTIPLGANAYGLPALADFNKDGKLDLAVVAETSGSQAELLVSNGNGDGTFAAPTVSKLRGGDAIRSASLATADFDGDTKADLALFDAVDYSGVFYGKGDGTFTSVPASGYIVPKDLLNIAAGSPAIAIDLNKDAKPDILAGGTVLLNLYGSAPVLTASTTTALTASSTSITVGASVTFTATVASGAPGTPTGSVTFYDGTTALGTGTVNASGVATYTTSALIAGTHSITASYPGDTNFSTSTSSATSVTVSPAVVATTTTLAATSTSAVSGTSITFTATVAPSNATGTVTFSDGSVTLGTGTLAAGVATYTTSTLGVGTHSITAAYGGANGSFSASTSSALAVTISAPVVVTTTRLAASSTSAVSGTSITFTATVSPASGTTLPTGTVTFSDGSVTLGTGTLAAGVATYATSTLAVGTHSITATYGGASGSFSASTSSAVAATITAAPAADFTITLGPTSTTVVHGSPASTTVSITPSGGFTAATSVACTGAPLNSSCSVSPSPVTPVGAGAATTTVTLQTSVTTASLEPRIQRYALAGLPLGLLTGLTLFLLPRKRRPALFGLIVAFAATAGLLGTTGCGGSKAGASTVTTAPGTYTLTITGSSGTTSHAATWTVTVQ